MSTCKRTNLFRSKQKMQRNGRRSFLFCIFFVTLLGNVRAEGVLPDPPFSNTSSLTTSLTTTQDPVGKIRHLLPKPNIGNNSLMDVTVQFGATAFLPCSFIPAEDEKITNDQVSWFRRRDWHILTTGIFTYTNDERFSVHHQEDGTDWTLQIKYTNRRDNGTYECQLSTGNGVISQFVNLNVVVPKAVILGSSEYHVQLGSTIKLVCVIEESPTPPQYVFWFHNDHMINYDNQRGGIKVNRETGVETRSYLTIIDATYEDNGNYTCMASNTQPASTNVFVSYGDKMAAIQRRESSSKSFRAYFSTIATALAFLVSVWHLLLDSDGISSPGLLYADRN